ncbi:MAG TPA: hypothetical protein VMF08_08690 [Candidatus Sulfotelmatobacter sp.]|nr:hypothetical protein [Candidatus Sulfotelmatobacter sp.]
MLTLPASPNVGDIVTVTGVGSNGWQVVPVPGQTIIGGSSASLQWVEQSGLSASNGWDSVASSSDGSHLVVADVYGDVFTSANAGANWAGAPAVSSPGYDVQVAVSPDGSSLAVAVDDGLIYTSDNFGSSWAAPYGDEAGTWLSVALSSDGYYLLAGNPAVGVYGWYDYGFDELVNNEKVYAAKVAIASESGQIVAAAADTGIYIGSLGYNEYGEYGIIWTLSGAPSVGWNSVATSSDGTHLVAVGGGGIYTSTNSGANWTLQTGAPQSANWFSVASSSDGSHLVAGVSGGGVYVSANFGVNWTLQTSAPQSANWSSVASSSNGNEFVATANGGGVYISAGEEFVGAPGTTVEVQYIGNGQWQSLATPASQISGIVSTTQLPSTVVTNTESGVTLSGTFSGNGAGLTNTPTTANYLDSYSTVTNAVVTASTFQNITSYSTAQINGWTYDGIESFTCSQAGLYLVQYCAEATTKAAATTTVSVHAVDNGTEITDSQSTAVSNTTGQTTPISKSFIATFNAGDVLQFQFAGSSTDDRLVSNFGLGTTRPSFSCTIIRIQ